MGGAVPRRCPPFAQCWTRRNQQHLARSPFGPASRWSASGREVTRPSPRPRKEKAGELGVTSQKSASERLTGVAEQPAEKPAKQATFSGLTFIRSQNPIGFEAAMACKTGEGLVGTDEQSTDGAK